MNRLTWSINGAIGIDAGLLHLKLIAIIAIAEGAFEGWTGSISLRIGKGFHTMVGILGLEEIFALAISHSIMLFPLVVSHLLLDMQLGTSNGLTCRGTDHHIADGFVLRLGLSNSIDISDEVKRTLYLSRGIGLKFHHIYAYGQTLERKTVFEEFIRRMTLILTFLLQYYIAQKGLDFLIALVIGWCNIYITLGIDTKHLHGERLKVAQLLQLHLLRLLWLGHLTLEVQAELGIGHIVFSIRKHTNTFPTFPALLGFL